MSPAVLNGSRDEAYLYQSERTGNLARQRQKAKLSVSPMKQDCHTCYGLFLLYKKKDGNKAAGQFEAAYVIPVNTYERK